MLSGEKILVTGVTGKIAFPIARELAKNNEVWGSARLGKPGDREKLAAAGINPLKFDMSIGKATSEPLRTTQATYFITPVLRRASSIAPRDRPAPIRARGR